jgi:guanylate kinase
MKRQPPLLAKRRGIIFILSAPSGAGKTTLYNGLRANYPEIRLSVSWTTRARRRGEISGRDYLFISERQFAALKRRGEFAEWARVHDYLRHAEEAARAVARDKIFPGYRLCKARKIKQAYPKRWRSLFCRRRWLSSNAVCPSWHDDKAIIERRKPMRG